MNIVLAIQDLNIGGTERQIVVLAKGLKSRGHNVSICCLNTLGPFSLDASKDGIPVDCLHKAHRYDLSILPKLCDYLKSKKADVLQTFLFGADLWGRMAGRLAGVKVLLTSERAGGIYSSLHEIWADRLLWPLSDGLIANTNIGGKKACQIGWVPSNKVFVVHNGIDLSNYGNSTGRESIRKRLGLRIGTFVIAWSGTVKPVKNPQMLVAVAKILKETGIDFVFLVIGDGPSLTGIRDMVAGMFLSDNFKFLGNRLDVPELLAGADAGVLCSHWEGFPNAIMDYMACRLPVVVTDVGGVRDIVQSDKNGFLVPDNEPYKMAEKLIALAESKDLINMMGLAGRKKLEDNFEQGVLAKITETHYNAILLEKGKV